MSTNTCREKSSYMYSWTSNQHLFMEYKISIISQSLNLDGRRGTTDGVATIPFHPSLSSAALRESRNSIHVHSLMLSSHIFLFISPPLFLAPSVPCRIVFAMPWDLEMRPYHLSFRFFTMFRSSCTQSSCILGSVVRHMVIVGNVQKSSIASYRKGLDPYWSSAIKVQLSQA